MRVLFCGSGGFAVPALRAVVSAGHDVAAVFTQPARAAGRGGRLRSTPVAQAARDLALAVHECPNINAEETLRAMRPARGDVVAVADFGQKVGPQVRELTPHGAFNLHASLLPELRGAAPINWAIIRGCQRTGVTTYSLVDAMDAGPIYLTAETDVAPEETAGELEQRLAGIGASLVCDTLEGLAQGRLEPREQDHSRATTAPRLKKSDGRIDWSADAQAIRCLVHGTFPWPGGQALFLSSSRGQVPVILARVRAEGGPAAAEPGALDADLCVRAGNGRLRILELKPAGKRLMAWRDFVNGYRVVPGDRFTAPRA
jgi:methionyl-tRNA formyltransferase